jgi:hypothetical protein
LPLIRKKPPDGRINIKTIFAPDLPEHGRTIVDEKDVNSMPLIIPPLRNKQYNRYGQIFSELWIHAESVISECQELFIIGYSFPDTDLASKDLFSKALKQNKYLKQVVIINPNPQKIESLFLNDFNIQPSKIKVKVKNFDVSYVGMSSVL